MKNGLRKGFTLIELIVVIAILAFVAMVGIHSYGNIREVQAKKMNVANIKRVYHALATYDTLMREESKLNYFDYFDSLVDVSASGAWTGSPGTYLWTGTAVSGQPGLYDGSWKNLLELKNAKGEGGRTYTLGEAQDENRGTRETGLLAKLALYHVTSDEVALLKEAGIRTYLLHNPSTGQASSFCKVPEGVNVPGGGGPGFRPDMSAYYPAMLEAGSPVAVIKPLVAGQGGATTISETYRNLGYFNNATNVWTTSDTDQEKYLADMKTKLIVFGIGQNAQCVRGQIGLGEPPCNPAYDKRHYRSYLAVFAITEGGQGVASTCKLAGVIDCAGNTYKAAEYAALWQTELN